MNARSSTFLFSFSFQRFLLFFKFSKLFCRTCYCSCPQLSVSTAGRQVLIRLALRDINRGKLVKGRPPHLHQPTIERVRDALCAPSPFCLRRIRAQKPECCGFGRLPRTIPSFFFSPVQFHARETACGPKKRCFWDGMNLGRWVSVGFLGR